MNDVWSVISEKNIYKELAKIAHSSMINMGSNPIFINFVGVHPRNIHTKDKANMCICLRDDVKNEILHNDI